MSEKNTVNRRTLLLGGGAALGIAGLGIGTGALWNVTDGFTQSPIQSGEMDVETGDTTLYFDGVDPEANPEEAPNYETNDFYKLNAERAQASLRAGHSPIWVTDFNFVAVGDNLQAIAYPTLTIDTALLTAHLEEDEKADYLASLEVVSEVYGQFEHVDHITHELNADDVYVANDNQMLYQVIHNTARYDDVVSSLPDVADRYADQVFFKEYALTYEEANGGSADTLDPDGTLREFSANVYGDFGDDVVAESMNVPLGDSAVTVVTYLRGIDYSTGFGAGITQVNDAVNLSWNMEQMRGNR